MSRMGDIFGSVGEQAGMVYAGRSIAQQ